MDNKKMAPDMELEDVRKESVRSFLDLLHKKASSVLSLVTKWKEFEDQYQSMQGSIEARVKEARLAEELVVQRYQELGAREEALRMREESLEVSLKEILEREEEVTKLKLSLIEQQRVQIDWFRQKLKDIELERNSAEKGIEQMREIQERVDMHCKAIRKETAERECILEEKLSELSWREHRLEQQVKKFESEKRKLYEEIEERSEVLDMKERELVERSKELELGKNVPERKRKEIARMPPSIICSSASYSDEEDYLIPRKISKGISTGKLVAKQKNIHETSKAGGETQLGSDEAQEPDTIELPNSDFTDFDKQKAVECFAADQVWAVYDSIDSMPRYYAWVRKVTFSPEFKLVITWLDPNSEKEDEQIWENAGLPVACGKFKNGRTVKTNHRFMFSHRMSSLGGVNRKSTWLIYPKKGEIWAVFKDWSMEWKAEPEKHTSPYHFDYVEVCSNFDRSTGIKVSYLSKVEGFTSIYERRPAGRNGIATFRVPEEEMYRFSHQIPSNHMTGKEAPGVPVGSFELDTAALPGGSIILDHPNDVICVESLTREIKAVQDLLTTYINRADAEKKKMNGIQNSMEKLAVAMDNMSISMTEMLQRLPPIRPIPAQPLRSFSTSATAVFQRTSQTPSWMQTEPIRPLLFASPTEPASQSSPATSMETLLEAIQTRNDQHHQALGIPTSVARSTDPASPSE